MKIVTPFDLWRAGFEVWLTGWQVQMAMGARVLSGLTAWQQAVRADGSEPVAQPPRPTPRARKRA
jgi:hypothetical protein